MAVIKELGDGGPDGTRLGKTSTELVSFHGKDPVDQATIASIATAATVATAVASIQSLIALLVEKGICAYS